MTEAMFAAVVVVGLLACLNLVLTVGLSRRLRQHAERLDALGTGPEPAPQPEAGTPIPDFTATTVDAVEVHRERFALGSALVGFFTASCPPCHEQLRAFARFAAGVGRERVLVVIGGRAEAGADQLVATAQPVAHVVLEEDFGPVTSAFQVNQFPAMLALSNGVVQVHATAIEQLPSPTPA